MSCRIVGDANASTTATVTPRPSMPVAHRACPGRTRSAAAAAGSRTARTGAPTGSRRRTGAGPWRAARRSSASTGGALRKPGLGPAAGVGRRAARNALDGGARPSTVRSSVAATCVGLMSRALWSSPTTPSIDAAQVASARSGRSPARAARAPHPVPVESGRERGLDLRRRCRAHSRTSGCPARTRPTGPGRRASWLTLADVRGRGREHVAHLGGREVLAVVGVVRDPRSRSPRASATSALRSFR